MHSRLRTTPPHDHITQQIHQIIHNSSVMNHTPVVYSSSRGSPRGGSGSESEIRLPSVVRNTTTTTTASTNVNTI